MLRVTDLTTANGLTISFEVPEGTCLALTGPSGSGKSLTLRGIADLDPTRGTVTLNEVERADLPAPDWRRKVCYVAAEPGFWEPTLREAIGAAPKDLLGLSLALLDDPVMQLSTGQRQRGALLRALAQNPSVLLLDEPCSALDEAATMHVEAALHRYLGQGGHIVLVTHDAAQGKRMANAHIDLGVAS